MFLCYVCFKPESCVVNLRAHLLRHKVVGELEYPILCCHCNSTLANIYNLIRHSENYHTVSNDVTNGMPGLPCDENLARNSAEQAVNLDYCVGQSTNFSVNIRAEGITLVAIMRAKSSIPYNVISTVVKSFNHISKGAITALDQTQLDWHE
jgi:hypothetical protein